MKTLAKQLYFLLLILLFVVSACQEKKRFGDEEPYSVIAHRYRNYFDAKNALERVLDKGLDAYMICQNAENEGIWYSILISAANDLEPMMEKKIDFEDSYGLKELQIVNYNKIRNELLPIKEKNIQQTRIDATLPDVGYDVVDLLSKLPANKYYSPVQMRLFNTLDSVRTYELSSLRKIKADLPRGVSQVSLFKNSDCWAELIYKDDLSYNSFTLHVARLKSDHVYGDSIAHFFSEKILDTREYQLEEMIPVSIDNVLGLEGYIVNLTPRPELLKSYCVLVDASKRYLIFIQSEKNNQNYLTEVGRMIGQSEGMTNYEGFFNTFCTSPRYTDSQDSFIYFQLDFLNDVKGRSASLRSGHYQGKSIFWNEDKGTWETNIITSNDIISSQKVFESYYRNTSRIKKDSIQIFGRKGWITSSRRRDRKTGRYANFANEVQFYTESHIIAISNKNKAWLTEEELLERAKSMQVTLKF